MQISSQTLFPTTEDSSTVDKVPQIEKCPYFQPGYQFDFEVIPKLRREPKQGPICDLNFLRVQYLTSVENCNSVPKSDLARSFESYMAAVRQNFRVRLNFAKCQRFKTSFARFDEQIRQVELLYQTKEERSSSEKLSVPQVDPVSRVASHTTAGTKIACDSRRMVLREFLNEFYSYRDFLVRLWLFELCGRPRSPGCCPVRC